MRIKTNLMTGLFMLLSVASFCQAPTPKTLPAKRTNQKVKIDGLITDSAWKDANMATGLIEFRPKVGAPEENSTRSETYLMYDDEGIYFGGYLYERTKDSISTELRGRDGFGNNDFIGIIFDTYKDHQNGFEYFITPLNEQMDAKVSPGNNDNGGEDFSWNAVWESGAVIHADGWSFEIFIPYAAIRFGNKNIQDWGLNITRRRQKTGQQYMWNPVDPNVNGFLTQEGYWTGITNIKAPLRLQFSPYFSTYANHFPANIAGVSNWTSQVNGGLDVKYGITPAFTLDATLIPDFGQVQSDNRILNLTPFDVQFNENRAFFTEGTELFSKGDLFYSRRIGVEPVYNQLSIGTDEQVIKQPRESKLINATKISGRTQKGLGIGLLNAVTKPRYATLEHTISKEHRTVEVEPLTNYNVLVLDQTLKNNSSISLVNTNVWRNGTAYDANVTAALFSLNDKKNMWNVSGKASLSNQIGYLPDGKTLTGYSQNLSFGKTSGRFNFNVFQDITDTKYTHRDLGFFTNNNFLIHGLWVGYRWTEPKGWYNRIFINVNTRYSKLLTKINPIDQSYQTSNLNINVNMQSKKLWWAGGYLGMTFRENDFYEPRWIGHFFRRNASLGFGGWFESNSAKKYSFYAELFGRKLFNFYDGIGFDYFLQQNYRFNSKLSLTYRISIQPRFNNVGYAYSENNSEIIFARRNRRTVENVLSSKYNFTNRMGLTFRLRHYYSSVDNKEYFTLRSDGKLNPNPTFNKNVNRNLNLFNIDMVYTWQFAPGSFLNLVWKSSVEEGNNIVEKNYIKNFSNTLEADQINNLSMKVIYFLDYLQIKNKKKKKIV